jgi:hypothetical protein
MKYAVEMGSAAMTNMSRFIKFGSGIQKSKGEGSNSQTRRAWRSHKLTLGNRLKNTDETRDAKC